MTTVDLYAPQRATEAPEAGPGETNCKICGALAIEKFRLPGSKLTGPEMPDLPDDCPYYECTRCRFCFTRLLDQAEHEAIYDDHYWSHQDPDWFGRVSETLRLVLLGSRMMRKSPDTLQILDFGCGANAFVHTCRRSLKLDAWGTDIVPPKFAAEYFLPQVDRQFDLVVACEVVEHLPDPLKTFRQIKGMVRSGGVFAFQTACWEPRTATRDWWYIGPGNGHISLYSRESLEELYRMFGGRRRRLWRRYPGIQAWQVWDDGVGSLARGLLSWTRMPL